LDALIDDAGKYTIAWKGQLGWICQSAAISHLLGEGIVGSLMMHIK
jgi:hypothetical protein